jgi:ABC-type nitrate/sulfonate/bicarbonate transport system substrate-binding protein
MAGRNDEHLVIPRASRLSRKKVAEHFAQAFELIGGVPRLAAWAHDNPTDFFKLYAKLFPAANADLEQAPVFLVLHGIPPTDLDKSEEAPKEVVVREYAPRTDAD